MSEAPHDEHPYLSARRMLTSKLLEKMKTKGIDMGAFGEARVLLRSLIRPIDLSVNTYEMVGRYKIYDNELKEAIIKDVLAHGDKTEERSKF